MGTQTYQVRREHRVTGIKEIKTAAGVCPNAFEIVGDEYDGWGLRMVFTIWYCPGTKGNVKLTVEGKNPFFGAGARTDMELTQFTTQEDVGKR